MYSLSSQNSQSWLIWFLRGLLVLGFLFLIARLIDLQLIRGDYFRELSEGNRVRRITVQAPRGKLLARGGEELVTNSQIKKKVDFENDRFVKKETEESGENVITEPLRTYILGSSLAHTTGYVGEVEESELGKVKGECVEKGIRKLGDIVGKIGLEKWYDCQLSGINGEILYEVDAKHQTARVLGVKDPIPGEDIQTNIDYELQLVVSQLLGDQKGAIIVSDPNGEIISLYSNPSFDPNSFTKRDSTEISQILKDKSLPLFNRVLGGRFHPGSVYKPLIALAALESGSIEDDFSYQDTGEVLIKNIYGSYSYKNWYFIQYGGVEGLIGIQKALARSTDTFFYKVGELMGINNIKSWSDKFGLGSLTGIDIPGEVSGLVPSPEWKEEVKSERWFLGDTFNVSIGQGDLAVSPLEINTAISSIANGGKICIPKIKYSDDTECSDLGVSKENVEVIIDGMKQACETGGTAYPFFDFKSKSGVDVACKTGTAQNVGEDPHAWFVAFAPINKPEIVVTILVENGGEGSSTAAPIARKIFDYYFNVNSLPSSAVTVTPTQVIQ